MNKLTIQDRDFPMAFRRLEHPPKRLYYIGQPVWQTMQLISVVGSRNPSRDALVWMEQEFPDFLRKREIGVVSGGALGIDQKAHEIAIRTGRPTVAFLPSGLNQIYPTNLRDWVEPILKTGGAIVSQFQPDQMMEKLLFQERNELIAAISPMTVVIEARRQSGTLLTAKYATELGRTVAVLPTFPNHVGMGGLDLIFDGAMMVRDHLDLLGLCDLAQLIDGKG